MKILITGANGHIGNHIVRSALAHDHVPIAFARPKSDRRALEGLDVEVREGDLLDQDSLALAMKGVDAVIHAGAVHQNFTEDPDDIVRPSVEGTANVLAAMKTAGVRKMVHTSTGATVGFAPDPAHPLDESHVFDAPTNPYIRGKYEAEKLVVDATAAGDVDAIIVNPSGVFGPLDYRLTPANRAIVGLLTGDPAFLHLCLTHVADVAEGHLRALALGRPGERYLLTGDVVAPKALSALVAELAGVKPPTFRPPAFLLRFLAGRAEKKALRDGSDAPITRTAIADLAGGHLAYDSAKSRRELDMSYRPGRKVLSDTFRWLLHVDALPAKVRGKVRAALGNDAAPDPSWR